MRLRVLHWLLAGLVLATAAPASALVLQRFTLKDLVARSAAVVRGVVHESEARWNADHTRIHTYWKVEVAEPVYGAARGQVLTVVTLGGTVDGVRQTMPGNVRLASGEKVFLFLVKNGDDHSIAGVTQGKFTVVADPAGAEPRLTRDVPSGTGGLSDAPTLGELVAKVRALRKEVAP